jgi:hypothetical protein
MLIPKKKKYIKIYNLVVSKLEDSYKCTKNNKKTSFVMAL